MILLCQCNLTYELYTWALNNRNFLVHVWKTVQKPCHTFPIMLQTNPPTSQAYIPPLIGVRKSLKSMGRFTGCTASQEEFHGVQPLLDSTAGFSIYLTLLRVKKQSRQFHTGLGKCYPFFGAFIAITWWITWEVCYSQRTSRRVKLLTDRQLSGLSAKRRHHSGVDIWRKEASNFDL